MLLFFSIFFLKLHLSVHAVRTLYELSPCSTAHSFEHYFGITVEDCKVKCERRSACEAINYNHFVKHCSLRNSTEIPLKGTEPKWCYDIIINNETTLLDGPCKEKPCNETNICIDNNKVPFYECITGYCKAETDIAHASFRLKVITSIGSKNELVCDNGYTPLGKQSLLCLNSGNWSTTTLECLKTCPSIPIKSSAIVDSWSTYRFVQNTIATFICKNGFYNITERKITCNSDGTWSDFECLPYCRQADIVPVTNGNPISGDIYTIFEQAEYECSQGYYLSPGSRFVSCSDKGTWSQPEVQCYKFCYQNDIPKIENGSPLPGTIYNYSMAAKYTCNNGYYLSDGSPEITCSTDGKWSTPQVECYKFCQVPTISNGNLQNIPTQPILKDVSVTYSCNHGYYTHPGVSNPSAVCQHTGMWIYPAECYKHCPNAPDYKWEKVEGYSSNAPYTVGTFVQYKCSAILMHFSGGKTKTCNRDGGWDGEVHCCGPCHNYKDGKCRCDCWPC